MAIAIDGVWLAIGVGLVFGRWGTRVDRRARTITTWWGPLFLYRSTTRPLDEFERVTIAREVRRSGHSAPVYPVQAEERGEPAKLGDPPES